MQWHNLFSLCFTTVLLIKDDGSVHAISQYIQCVSDKTVLPASKVKGNSTPMTTSNSGLLYAMTRGSDKSLSRFKIDPDNGQLPLLDSHTINENIAFLALDKNEQYLLAASDSEGSVSEVLRDFAQKRQLNTKNWSLLTGTAADVRSLAMVLDIKFQNMADNEVNHSNLITGLDSQGRIQFQELGIITNARKAVEKLIDMDHNQ
jgi:hypothetical protein